MPICLNGTTPNPSSTVDSVMRLDDPSPICFTVSTFALMMSFGANIFVRFTFSRSCAREFSFSNVASIFASKTLESVAIILVLAFFTSTFITSQYTISLILTELTSLNFGITVTSLFPEAVFSTNTDPTTAATPHSDKLTDNTPICLIHVITR